MSLTDPSSWKKGSTSTTLEHEKQCARDLCEALEKACDKGLRLGQALSNFVDACSLRSDFRLFYTRGDNVVKRFKEFILREETNQ